MGLSLSKSIVLQFFGACVFAIGVYSLFLLHTLLNVGLSCRFFGGLLYKIQHWRLDNSRTVLYVILSGYNIHVVWYFCSSFMMIGFVR